MRANPCFIIASLILIAFQLESCDVEKKDTSDIKGNWVLYRTNERIIPGYAALLIKESSIYDVGSIGMTRRGDYIVKNDSLMLSTTKGDKFAFKIVKLSVDSLVLFDGEFQDVYYNEELDYDESLKLKAIHLRTKNCPDECSEISLDVSGVGDAEFTCIENCTQPGHSKVGITTKEWQKLDSLFKWSKINKIDTTDLYQAMDDWPMSIEFIYNDSVNVKIRGTEIAMPYRIQPIIYQLINRLKADSLLKH